MQQALAQCLAERSPSVNINIGFGGLIDNNKDCGLRSTRRTCLGERVADIRVQPSSLFMTVA